MSTPIREAVEAHQDIAQRIQAFMWTGRPHKSEPIPRTAKELEDFLEEIRKESWSSYNDGARGLGWTE